MKLVLIATVFLLASAVTGVYGQTLTPVFDQNGYSGTEGEQIKVCLSLPDLVALPQDLRCTFTVVVMTMSGPEDDATFGTDYIICNNSDKATLNFLPGSDAPQCFYICPVVDGIVELGGETLTVQVSSGVVGGECSGELTIPTGAMQTVQIDDSLGDVVKVKFNVDEVKVTEGDNATVTLCAMASGQYSTTLTVGVSCTPTNADGVDPAQTPADWMPSSTPTEFTFSTPLQDISTSCIVINIVDDTLMEQLESFICTLLSGSTQSVQSTDPEQVTVDIFDNDVTTIRWEEDFYCFNENDPALVAILSDMRLTASLSVFGVPTQITSGVVTQFLRGRSRFFRPRYNTVVFRSTTYGVATVSTGPTRDVLSTPRTFSFSTGGVRSAGSFALFDDNVCEGDEIFMAVIDSSSTGFLVQQGQPNVTYIAIKDNDRTEIGFTQASYTTTESAGHVNISVSSSGAFYGPLSVTVTCSPGTADRSDFGAGTYTTTFIVDRQATSIESLPIRIPITNDNIPENEECFVCRITAVSGLSCASIDATLRDTRVCIRPVCPSDRVMRLGFSPELSCRNPDPPPGAQMVQGCFCPRGFLVNDLTGRCIRPSDCPLCVGQASGDPHYITYDGRYYDLFDHCSHVFSADCRGNTFGVYSITSNACTMGRIPTCIDRAVVEVPPLSVTIHLFFRGSSPTYTFEGVSTLPSSISVIHSGNRILVHIGDYDVYVWYGRYFLKVQTPVSYRGRLCGLLGNCNGGQDDDWILRNGTVVTNVVDLERGYRHEAYASLCDSGFINPADDPMCPVTQAARDFCAPLLLTSGPYAACHDLVDPQQAYENCLLDHCFVNGSLLDGPCRVILDYADGCRQRGLTIPIIHAACRPRCPAGQTYRCGPIRPASCKNMTAIEGRICEEGCYCNVGTVLDDNGNCVVPRECTRLEVCFSIDPPNYVVDEGGKVDITLKTNRRFDAPFSIISATSDGSARAPGDYLSLMLSVNFDVASQMAMAMVMANTDNVCEGNEDMFLTISSRVDGVDVCANNRAMIIIRDRTPRASICFGRSAITIREGSGFVSLPISISGTISGSQRVSVTCTDGSATSGADYISATSIVTIQSGASSATHGILIVDNTIAEKLESFTCTLSLPGDAGSCLSVCSNQNTITVNVEDDDNLVCGFTNASVMVKENVGTVTKSVECNRPAQFDFAISVATVSGSAQSGSDFVPVSQVLRFTSGTTRVNTAVQIIDGSCSGALESVLETFTCALSASQSALDCGLMLGRTTSTVTIMDDDVQVMFADNDIMAMEDRRIDFSITAAGFVNCPSFTVVAEVVGGTATVGEDFSALSCSVNFGNGITQHTCTINPICDAVRESDETIILRLRVQSGSKPNACTGPISMMTINLMDNCDRQRFGQVNDTVIADPVYTVPLLVNEGNHSFVSGTPLCYEIHGETGRTFNLISDECTSVNAFYESARNPAAGNVITSIGVVATDRTTTTTASVNVTEDGDCFTVVDGDQALPPGEYTLGVIRVRVDPGCVRISVPNCGRPDLVYWVRCKILTLAFHDEAGRRTIEQVAIKFVVGRGLGLDPTAHGLIGQFWGVPVDINPYTLFWISDTFVPRSRRWLITMQKDDPRSFAAIQGDRTWTHNGVPIIPNSLCLYAGDSQGGPLGEARHRSVGPVIEGHYTEYICKDGIFDTSFTYSKYLTRPP